MTSDVSGATRCYHCGLPVPEGGGWSVTIDGAARPMCCPGCQAVAQAIVAAGLDEFYRHRSELPDGPGGPVVPEFLDDLAVFDSPAIQRSFVRAESGELREAALILEGITCPACVWLNERYVSGLPGVQEFRVNYATHRATVRWDNEAIALSEILAAIAGIGYRAHPYDPERQQSGQRAEQKASLRRLTIAGLGTVQVMMLSIALYAGEGLGMDAHTQLLLRWAALLMAGPVLVFGAWPFFRNAWRDLRLRRLGMDVPVAIAIGTGFVASVYATVAQQGEIYFDSVTMFTFLLLLGRYLELVVRHRAGAAAEALVKLAPARAFRWEGGRAVPVAAVELAPGDRVLVKAGDAVPADGVVIEGGTEVDESMMTGESVPVAKAPGDAVVGGTVNRGSAVTMRVERVGQDSALAAILRLLDRAQAEKPRLARVADRVAGWFVAAVLTLASIVFAVWWWLDSTHAFWVTLSVLIVTCPCALSLATPAALTAGTGRLSRLGLLATRGHAVETLARATHIIFDKTGTLTQGRPGLKQVQMLGGWDRSKALEIAAALEAVSEHPFAQAIAEAAQRDGLDSRAPTVAGVRTHAGLGVSGTVAGQAWRIGTLDYAAGCYGAAPPALGEGWAGLSPVLLANASGPVALLGFSDTLRADARETVQAFAAAGLQVGILSGDRQSAVDGVARELGVAWAEGGLSPEAKLAAVAALQRDGAVVAMVGDGINDAPVLTGAAVSIAVGEGTHVAQASADLVLLSPRLTTLVTGVHVSRRTLRIIRQNLAWAASYNATALPLAAIGLVTPWMAAIGMSLSSLLVVLNAMRLAPDQLAWGGRRTTSRPSTRAATAEGSVRLGAAP